MTDPANTLLVLAAISFGIWVVLLLFRGGFWRADQYLPAIKAPLQNAPNIVAIIPARNEEATIGSTLTPLLAQDYVGKLSIIVVNDNSEDETKKLAEIACREKDDCTNYDQNYMYQCFSGCSNNLYSILIHLYFSSYHLELYQSQ